MQRKWLPWLIALVPVPAALLVIQTVPPRDFRESGGMTVFALTPLILSVLIAKRRPWQTRRLAHRFVGTFALGGAIFVFLFAGIFGTETFLRGQFGLFVGVDGYGPRAIAAGPTGYVVAGDNSDSDGIVWYSIDGRQWSRVEHSDVFDRLDVGDVIWTDSEFLLVAHDDRRGPIVTLVSSDGLSWSRSAASSIDGKPYSVALNDGKLAIVGSSYSNDGVFVHGTTAGTLLTAEPKPLIDRNRDQFFVARHKTGFLSAGNQNSDAVLMISDDGSRWTELHRFDGVVLSSMTSHEGGYAAVGLEKTSNSPQVWVSENGVNWARAEFPIDDSSVKLDLVSSYGNELFVIGHEVSSAETRIWQSSDGLGWNERQSPFGKAVMRDALMNERFSIVVGVDRDLDSAAIWTSTDNLTWQRIAHSEMFSVR